MIEEAIIGGLIVFILSTFILPPLIKLRNNFWAWVWKERRKTKKINLVWKNDRKIFSNVKELLRQFNSMGDYSHMHNPQECIKLASSIEEEVQKIQGSEFQDIKEKLLEYAMRKNNVSQNMLLRDLLNLFRKRIESNKYEPLVLVEEIDEVLKSSSIPPSERKKKGGKLFKK